MKKLILSLPIVAVFLSFIFSSCQGKSEDVSIVVGASTTRAIGCDFTLKSAGSSEGKKAVWTSSDLSVATVENGIVTALSPGEAVITATIKGKRKKQIYHLTVAYGCNNDTPGWGEYLGTVIFKTDRTWKVGNQEWSDVVVASACQKTTFSGGSWGNQNADCRSNPGYGDLFSWCAVIRFQDELCPDGWRVPTEKDFAILDMELRKGGDGSSSYTDTLVRNKYLELWGGTYSGYCGTDGQLGGQGWSAYYWTQAEHSENHNHGFRMNFHSDGYIFPQGWLSKDNGFALRCVR
jgi:uncharacterized protein (TIGR02145 family)